MGYDTVLKDMKRRNMEARMAAREKRDNDAGDLQNEIFRALPTREADAISVLSLKKLFPNEPNMRVATNVFFLFNYGRCRRIKRHDHPGHPSVIHYYYWKESGTEEISEGWQKSAREKILDILPISEGSAISSKEIRKRVGMGLQKSSVFATLTYLYSINRVSRKIEGAFFHYWKNINGEENGKKEEGLVGIVTIRDFLITHLSVNEDHALSISDLMAVGKGKYRGDVIKKGIQRLKKTHQIQKVWDGRQCYYYIKKEAGGVSFPSHGPENIVYIPSSSTEELLTKYKEDNKKLDERILNIEKQIADLGQKQELQAEIQKREENEKRLAELEEQLHKIAIADTSVKRGILH